MLGQPMPLLIPQVLGFKLRGELPEGATATDLVLTVTEMLRERGVVGKFVEFYGHGLAHLPLADRATIGNMSPEFGSTCAIFPIDAETLRYLEFSGRDAGAHRARRGVRQGAGPVARRALRGARLLRHDRARPRRGRAVAGRPQAPAGPRRAEPRAGRSSGSPSRTTCPEDDDDDRQPTVEFAALSFPASDPPASNEPPRRPPVHHDADAAGGGRRASRSDSARVGRRSPTARVTELDHGHVVIAAITCCTNTSNPSVMVAAGLLARNAVARGLRSKPWVKTSLAPGSKVVTEYLDRAGLTDDLEALGFHLVGYGCTTCIGNSGPLPREISRAVAGARPRRRLGAVGQPQLRGAHQPRREDELPRVAAARRRLRAGGDDGRRHRQRAARPGSRRQRRLPARRLAVQPRGRRDRRARPCARRCSAPPTRACSTATSAGTALVVPTGDRFAWDEDSTYVHLPPYFDGMPAEPPPVAGHRGRARARAARRLRHDRPHLAGRLDPARRPRRPVPAGARRRSRATSTPTARAAATTR